MDVERVILVYPTTLLSYSLWYAVTDAPVLRPHTRMFLRESLRLLRKEVLYYSVSLEEEVYNALQAELTLAIPRRQMHVPGQPMAPEAEPEDLVTLHFTSRRLLSEFKTKIHSRIVVIGASCTVSPAPAPGMHWNGGEAPPPIQPDHLRPPPIQGARPLPSHCLPDAKRQPQWHL